jgi:hypothetical protein
MHYLTLKASNNEWIFRWEQPLPFYASSTRKYVLRVSEPLRSRDIDVSPKVLEITRPLPLQCI